MDVKVNPPVIPDKDNPEPVVKTPLAPEVEKKERKARSDKGKMRGKKEKELSGLDVKLLLAGVLQGFSISLANSTKNQQWIMQKQEAENIEKALNYWIEQRLPLLETKYKPELVVLIALTGYFSRVAFVKPIKAPEKKRDNINAD